MSKLSKLRVEDQPITALKPRAGNARTHSKKQIRQIAESMREFGFTNPVLVDGDGRVIAGHGRIEAAKLLGLDTVPTIRLDHMTEAQVRAYVIADNKLAENAGWDHELLSIELQYLAEINIDFDLTITGFEVAEIDVLLGYAGEGELDEADEVPAVDDSQPVVSRLGDLWILGPHRLLCADATKGASFEQLLGSKRSQMAFIDPPYNVPIDGHVCGLGAIKHREFEMAAGEMTEAEYTAFLKTVLGHLAYYSIDGSIHFVCMDWRHMGELTSAGRATYAELKNLCVWNKDNGGMGSLYRSKHELVFVFKSGSGPHINNIELGRYGRYRTNVWDYPGVNSLREGRLEELTMHPTVKPVALVADAILDCSEPGGIVLDCFGGSGTTLVAAEKTGRCGYLLELEAAYVDVTIKRFHKFTGREAVHENTGLTFAEMCAERTGAATAVVDTAQVDEEEVRGVG